MGFLVPAFLAGLALSSIPLVIHLIFRRRAPQVVFAATRFLKMAVRKTQRRRNIDNLLLLALRTLLIALLAVGLAGPVVKRAMAGGRAGSDVAIIIDNSLSMSTVDDSVDRFSRAKEAIEDALSRLGPADLIAVIPTAPPESRAVTGFSADAAEVRTRAARLAVSKARGPLAAAFERAGELFAGSTSSAKLLYVITDLQANAFPSKESLSDATRAALLTVPAIVYDCGLGKGRDLAVSSVKLSTQGAVVGTPIEATAKITSSSPAQETVSVTLTAGAERLQHRTVTLAPGASAEVTLSTLAQKPGALDGFVEVETADGLAVDNRRYFSLLARDRIKALILEKERRTPAFEDDSFFLERALDPFKSDASGAKSPFDVTVRTFGDDVDFSKYDVVYVMLRSGLGGPIEERLKAYLASGGAAVVFLCDDASAAGARDWLPAAPVSIKSSDRTRGQSFTISSLDTASDALTAFVDEPSTLYNSVRVYDYWLTSVDDAGARVLARFDTGDAAIVEAGGSGRGVVLFTVAPVRPMGSFAASQFFLPAVYEITYRVLASSRGGGEVFAGDAVRLAGPGRSAGFVVTSPDGASHLVKPAEGAPLDFTATDIPGAYSVRDEGSDREAAMFCVNPDPQEYDLARLSADKVKAIAPGGPVLVANSPQTLNDALLSLKPVLALGDMLLYSVLGVALLECLAANRASGKPAGRA